MRRKIEEGLRWAVGLGLGAGLMLGAVCFFLWQPRSLGIQETAQPEGRETAAEADRPAGEENPQECAGRVVAFAVLPGMTFEEIADLLEASGAVPDREAFLARARELNALRRAQPGLYVLTQTDPNQPLSHDEIITQLVSGPASH